MKLSVNNLSFSFHRDLELFKNLSFELKAKECLYIKGSNGSGKTTLLRVIAGLQNYSEGTIEVSSEKKVFCEFLATEKNGLFYNLSALDNLLFWNQLNEQNLTREQILAEAKSWGLTNYFCLTQVPIKKFSTGMKRKIALIRTFLSPAPILLLDEPMNGLDIESSKIFIDSLLKKKSAGKLIIISSHHNSSLYEKAITRTLEL